MPSPYTEDNTKPPPLSDCPSLPLIIALALPLGVTLVPLVFWVVLSLSANGCEGYLRFMERMAS